MSPTSEKDVNMVFFHRAMSGLPFGCVYIPSASVLNFAEMARKKHQERARSIHELHKLQRKKKLGDDVARLAELEHAWKKKSKKHHSRHRHHHTGKKRMKTESDASSDEETETDSDTSPVRVKKTHKRAKHAKHAKREKESKKAAKTEKTEKLGRSRRFRPSTYVWRAAKAAQRDTKPVFSLPAIRRLMRDMMMAHRRDRLQFERAISPDTEIPELPIKISKAATILVRAEVENLACRIYDAAKDIRASSTPPRKMTKEENAKEGTREWVQSHLGDMSADQHKKLDKYGLDKTSDNLVYRDSISDRVLPRHVHTAVKLMGSF